jgi:hypothetical protein
VLSLIEGMLQAGVMDTVEGWQATRQGSPQGAVISPLLLSAVESKPASGGRIKTSHFFPLNRSEMF